MQTRKYHTMDKASWGPGPWQQEPDKVQFTDGATGLPCLIVRNGLGNLCGYVGVPESHPAYGHNYDTVYDKLYRSGVRGGGVHGGLTFAGKCCERHERQSICHVPGEGEPKLVWWLGFDCAHAWDLVPGLVATMRKMHEDHPEYGPYPSTMHSEDQYRDIEYVKGQIRRLAAALDRLARSRTPLKAAPLPEPLSLGYKHQKRMDAIRESHERLKRMVPGYRETAEAVRKMPTAKELRAMDREDDEGLTPEQLAKLDQIVTNFEKAKTWLPKRKRRKNKQQPNNGN